MGSAELHLKDSQITFTQVGKYFALEFGWYLETKLFTKATPVRPHQAAVMAALLHMSPKEQSPWRGQCTGCLQWPTTCQTKKERKKAVVLLPPILFFASEETTLSGSRSGICW